MWNEAKAFSTTQEEQRMHLYLLEFTYAVEDRATVEAWLAEANLNGILISIKQYDDEIFAVLASEKSVHEEHRKLMLHPAISSCQTKQSILYRITTTETPESVFHLFPLGEGDEWYWGIGRTSYLSKQSQRFSQAQMSWLATCSKIVTWEYIFDIIRAPLEYEPH